MDGWKMTMQCKQSVNKSTKTLRKAAFLAFVFGTLAVPTMGFATEASSEAPSMETGTVVVTGTRTEQLIEDVPQTMQVFTREDIERMSASDVRDILKTATGISVDAQKGGINFRGMGFDNTVLLINGRKVTTASNSKDAHNMYTKLINPSSIERIEIIRGQAGAMYGSNAIGGVVNIITKKSEKKGGVGGVVMGNEYFQNYWQLDTGKMGGFDAILNATVTKYYPGVKDKNFYKSKSDPNTKSGKWQKSIDGVDLAFNLDMGYAFNDDHEVRFFGHWAGRDISQDSRSNYTASMSTSNTSNRNYSGALMYNGTVEDHSFNFTVNYGEYQTDSYDKTDKEQVAYTDIYRTWTLNAYDSWSISDWNTLTFGGEYSYSNASIQTAIHGNELSYWSLFIQDEIALFDDSLFILLQGRYDHYDADFGGAFTPNIGVTWEFIEDHRVKANWGMGFRAPTLSQLYGYETTGNGTTYGSADLKPEKSKNFELRYEGKVGPVSGAIGYYYSYIEDYMSSKAITPTAEYYARGNASGVFERVNIGKVRNQGVELEAAWEIHDYVTLKGSYAHQDAQDLENDTRVNYMATDVINGGLDFTYPDWGLSASLWATYNANFKYPQDSAPSIVYDYFNMNFTAAKTWGEEDEYKVTLALYNFLQSKNDYYNINSLEPFEVRVGFEMKF